MIPGGGRCVQVPGVAVLHDDDQFAVLSKPAGVQCRSAQPAHTKTVERALPAYLRASAAADALPAGPTLVRAHISTAQY